MKKRKGVLFAGIIVSSIYSIILILSFLSGILSVFIFNDLFYDSYKPTTQNIEQSYSSTESNEIGASMIDGKLKISDDLTNENFDETDYKFEQYAEGILIGTLIFLIIEIAISLIALLFSIVAWKYNDKKKALIAGILFSILFIFSLSNILTLLLNLSCVFLHFIGYYQLSKEEQLEEIGEI